MQTAVILQGVGVGVGVHSTKEGEALAPKPMPLLGIGSSRRLGPYKVKEEVEKAPTYDHACNITSSSIRVNFQAGGRAL